ncbi:MAG: HesA/MoeB/ThiF family protein [Methanobrevibacter sp.]|jgi:molybdopterin/thiamine biosynthesis adenylyltransferase|nr:HesA/MoeB/ThiF family protein [Candidatus Methanovirga basalitermitum]
MPTRYIGDGYWEIISRQMSIVTKSQQERFKNAEITVIGTGGIGGATLEMLARQGVGKLNFVDKDVFDLSNLNRQVMSNLDALSIDKTLATKEQLRKINPYVKTNRISQEVNEDNVEEIIEGSDILIDAVDNLITRVILTRAANKLNIPYIHGAIHGTSGQITTFTNKTPTYEELFRFPSIGKKLQDKVREDIQKMTRGVPPVIGPVPNIVGCLEAMEAFKLITGIGKVTYAPELLTFDLLDFKSFEVQQI